ncbi:hypothetical protein K470DRAFT_298101 [Piedraia hortae CBS 480.64]|uniref:EF-hand n=1 Tax=Piedraia hortae CBS 480.64 TaxID=1314780 RepID=A0A6A7C8Q8_9PEZI|nr:hypothetical protein K470DRAFT_298101 [Piedraia hortae CBS 480.64]
MDRVPTASSLSTLKPREASLPTSLPSQPTPFPRPNLGGSGGGYTNLPPPLLRSMRECFSVLDSENTGTLTPERIKPILEQMGMDSSPSSIKEFFPPGAPQEVNLARYLDFLAGAMGGVSETEELLAAFEAFDEFDEGVVEVGELKGALLREGQLGERGVDAVLNEFNGRKGLKREVFRYRDFMVGIKGGGENIL